jgi:hypothetical protein
MKLLVAILAVLALVGSAMAWELSDDLSYQYVKSVWQEAGDNLVLGADIGATSNAHFYDPAVTTGVTGTYPTGTTDGTTFLSGLTKDTVIIPASAATVQNTLSSLSVDRIINYPAADLTNADFGTTLTQGGSASVALHSMSNDYLDALMTKPSTPEMQGTASAYQNLALAGGFDRATTSFNSLADVGVDNLFTVTQTGTTSAPNSASVDSQTHGGGAIEGANLGEQVTAGIVKDYAGSGWKTPEYAGGIKMWADFTACDPTCANPVVSTVSGSSWTSIFPGNTANPNWGGDSYWGGSSITTFSPFKV